MKKIMLLAASMAVLMASCQSEEQAEVIASDEALVSFGMDFSVEDAALTRAAHTFDYYVAVSADAPTDGNITSGYVGRFTSLVEASVVLQKGTTYNFYISAFENAGAEYDLSTYCATSGEFVEVTSATPVAPDFADTRVDRYYGSTSEEIVTNTTISVEGKRFAYGINVNIETPLEGKVVMSSESPAFTYTVTSSDDAKVENNIFCLAGTDEEAEKETTVTVKWYDGSNKEVLSTTKTLTIARNHMKTLKVKAFDPNVGFDFSVDEDDMEDDGTEDFPGEEGEGNKDPFNGYEYVDLGVVVDGKTVYWATTNIGAENPADVGLYFAWGETVGYTTDTSDGHRFIWSNYSSNLCGGTDSKMKKYCTDSRYGTVDGKTVLDLEDDAARVNWQGAWRMPTREEQEALAEQCTWTRTSITNSLGYSISGYKVSNKVDPNKFIFLPNTGNRTSQSNDGGSGYYWSSSLGTDLSNTASYLYFNYSYYFNIDYERCFGLTIRPVVCQ